MAAPLSGGRDQVATGDPIDSTTQGINGLNALLGLWLVLSPWVFVTSTAGTWNAWIVGAAVAALSAAAWRGMMQGGMPRSGLSGTVAILGLWMAVSPFIFAYGIGMAWNAVVVGLLLLVFGAYSSYELGRLPKPRRA